MNSKAISTQLLPILRKRLEVDITVLTNVLQEKTGNNIINSLLKSLVLAKYKLLDLMPFYDSETPESINPISGEKVKLKGYSSKYNLFLDDCEMLTNILRDTEKNQMDFIILSEQLEDETSNRQNIHKIISIYKSIGSHLDAIRQSKEFVPLSLSATD